jgi:hypothetical protein
VATLHPAAGGDNVIKNQFPVAGLLLPVRFLKPPVTSNQSLKPFQPVNTFEPNSSSSAALLLTTHHSLLTTHHSLLITPSVENIGPDSYRDEPMITSQDPTFHAVENIGVEPMTS